MLKIPIFLVNATEVILKNFGYVMIESVQFSLLNQTQLLLLEIYSSLKKILKILREFNLIDVSTRDIEVLSLGNATNYTYHF